MAGSCAGALPVPGPAPPPKVQRRTRWHSASALSGSDLRSICLLDSYPKLLSTQAPALTTRTRRRGLESRL